MDNVILDKTTLKALTGDTRVKILKLLLKNKLNNY